ncbi:RNA 2',3'-cyclic phosphodiesterase [Methylophaga thiooxydans]|uniref:RNA 2',3'-cyclic phosphodiesterase n=1 Tax=Methylophaga thiooxydans DMS010 TaxID=637616 RepID=C0N774_9GAMM|nr:RNA 2',3'-cyclic phosphodiesterase [Methylophaga thiooxydans]EEF79145.1 2'-5' RNA ligase [Methylophaga thiooxydans DMS010]
MKRLFFALWPDNNSRQQIAQINQQIFFPDIRKLIPDNLHITLVFLGNVDDAIATAVQQRAGDIIAPPISLEFNELDYWVKPKIVCLTCQRQPKAVYQLVNALTAMLAEYPVRVEQRPYRAHITLARKAKQRPELNFSPVVINADSFALVESISTEKGVRYQVRERWLLKG